MCGVWPVGGWRATRKGGLATSRQEKEGGNKTSIYLPPSLPPFLSLTHLDRGETPEKKEQVGRGEGGLGGNGGESRNLTSPTRC